MAKLSIQQAIEQAKANPNSEFATQLRKAIESGQLDQAAQNQGVDLSVFGRPKVQPQGKFGSETVSDIANIGQDILASSTKRAENITELGDKMRAGERSVFGTRLKQAGQLAGAGAEAIGAVTTGAIKAVLPQQVENKLKEIVLNLGEDVANIPAVQNLARKYAEATPQQQEAIDAIGGVVGLASEFVGVGTAKTVTKPAIKAVGEALDTAKKNISQLTLPKINTPSFSSIKLAKDVIKDVTPKAVDVADRQVAKALNLAPVEDIARFKTLTQNDLGEFMARNDLIQDTKEETVQSIAEFQRKNLDAKRDIVSLVEDRFTFEDLPELEGLIDNLRKDLQSSQSPEFQNQLKLLNDIKQSGEFDLTQVDYIRSLSDDINSFYTRTGEVRSGVNVADQEKLVNATRRFIEDVVSQKYPDINIKELNNNIRSSRFLVDTIAKRAGKDDTRSLASLGDYAVLGIGSNVAPGVGIASLLGKKLVESSPIRLRLARKLYGKDGRVNKTGKVTQKELKEINELIKSELDEIMNQGNITDSTQ